MSDSDQDQSAPPVNGRSLFKRLRRKRTPTAAANQLAYDPSYMQSDHDQLRRAAHARAPQPARPPPLTIKTLIYGILSWCIALALVGAVLSSLPAAVVGMHFLLRDDHCDDAARYLAEHADVYAVWLASSASNAAAVSALQQFHAERAYLAHPKCDDDRPYANRALTAADLPPIMRLSADDLAVSGDSNQ